MSLRERVSNVPWTPILLLLLIVSSCMNWFELRSIKRQISENDWDRHYQEADISNTLDAMNHQLGDISDNTSVTAVRARQSGPSWHK